jgi:hypothetical protein
MLELEREKGGVGSEMSKLDEQGIKSGQQLQDIFVKKGKNHGFNKGRKYPYG